MPGAWERTDSVLCCVLHVETTTVAWSLGIRNLQIPGGMMGITGMPFDHARNVGAMRALECGAEWLFFLDSDVVPPPDTILRLIAHRQPIISGVYHRRSPPAGVPVMMKDWQWVFNPPKNAIMEVDVVGAGCLLIHRSVLQQLPPQRPGKHWFDWRVDMQGILPREDCLSEDFTFCWQAKKAGYKILVDTSIQCKHIGYGEATYGSFAPLVN